MTALGDDARYSARSEEELDSPAPPIGSRGAWALLNMFDVGKKDRAEVLCEISLRSERSRIEPASFLRKPTVRSNELEVRAHGFLDLLE